MALASWDALAFFAFIALVVGVSLYQGRKEETSEDYFLAGRNLTWWLIPSRRTSRLSTSSEWQAPGSACPGSPWRATSGLPRPHS